MANLHGFGNLVTKTKDQQDLLDEFNKNKVHYVDIMNDSRVTDEIKNQLQKPQNISFTYDNKNYYSVELLIDDITRKYILDKLGKAVNINIELQEMVVMLNQMSDIANFTEIEKNIKNIITTLKDNLQNEHLNYSKWFFETEEKIIENNKNPTKVTTQKKILLNQLELVQNQHKSYQLKFNELVQKCIEDLTVLNLADVEKCNSELEEKNKQLEKLQKEIMNLETDLNTLNDKCIEKKEEKTKLEQKYKEELKKFKEKTSQLIKLQGDFHKKTIANQNQSRKLLEKKKSS